jgi:spore protease
MIAEKTKNYKGLLKVMPNNTTKNYFRTDLATECRAREGLKLKDAEGISIDEKNFDEITVSRLRINTKAASDSLGKPIGKYVTIGFPQPHIMTDRQLISLENILCDVLQEFIYQLSPNCHSVLTVGLGNMDITADSIGPRCISGITVTRHIKYHDPILFQKLCHMETSAIIPGVLGQTGFESASLILSAVEASKPDLVLVIDALAARSPERLSCTIQICDTGISPGSGVKNHRTALNQQYLKVPVIALGVPTVVDAATIIFDTLQKSQMTNLSPSIQNELDKSKDFFVSPKEIDAQVKILCPVISRAIDQALST